MLQTALQRKPEEGASLLFLNPPYDLDKVHGRLAGSAAPLRSRAPRDANARAYQRLPARRASGGPYPPTPHPCAIGRSQGPAGGADRRENSPRERL
jgi:hypothetical protein